MESSRKINRAFYNYIGVCARRSVNFMRREKKVTSKYFQDINSRPKGEKVLYQDSIRAYVITFMLVISVKTRNATCNDC